MREISCLILIGHYDSQECGHNVSCTESVHDSGEEMGEVRNTRGED